MERSNPFPGVRVAAAPCSFGVFTGADAAAGGTALLDVVAGLGYAGVDLGPPGYLGGAAGLAHRGLALAGGWVQVRAEDPDLGDLAIVLDAFDAAGGKPVPTLAAGGPAQAVAGRAPQLGAAEWAGFVALLRRAVDQCRARGYAPVFHPHVGTWVETPAQTQRLLDTVDVDLCLDTGHLALGGGDPLAALDDWGERITHVHLKDVRLGAARELAAAGAPLQAVWEQGVFCELGEGDLDLDAVLDRLPPLSGWLVVEQDRVVTDRDGWAAAAAAQGRNRAWLRERGW